MNKPTEMDLLKRENRELKKNVQTLKNENSDLKSEIAQGRDLFKKTKKSFSMVLITLILKLFSDGLNASQIHKTMNRFKNCLDIFDECEVPSLTYINSLRLSMPSLNELQAKDFVKKSRILTLAMDESPSNTGDKSFQVGVYNESAEYSILSFKEISGGTAQEIHDRVLELLRQLFDQDFSTFVKKIKFVSSDTASNQLCANKKLISSFMSMNGGHYIQSIRCSMHNISNMEKRAKSSNIIVDDMLNSISNGLGQRANQGSGSSDQRPESWTGP